ncbi:hypothetical protein EMK97_15080 [Litorilituus sediminis]|uniref:Uncharacterized protein n=1 Tax=Litorilituus sediminis TaxID=718192 RepID=A0A4P6P9I3_9GAMM|nr:hypothetical protein EMK97_15080 [Litorilituus sediminis]
MAKQIITLYHAAQKTLAKDQQPLTTQTKKPTQFELALQLISLRLIFTSFLQQTMLSDSALHHLNLWLPSQGSL